MKKSAGILLFRNKSNQFEFLLVHPGGPFWKNKNEGSWSIPKGEFTESENGFDAALREFREETGILLTGDFLELNPITMKSGKRVFAWAQESDFIIENLVSNTFEMEWPPKSGKIIEFPEVDRAEWFSFKDALLYINVGQADLIRQLSKILAEK